MHQQCDRGNIEGEPQEHIAGANIKLRRQRAARNVKLIEQVAGRQSHPAGSHILLRAHRFIGQILDVPCMKKDAAAFGAVLEAVHNIVNLVDAAAIFSRPIVPLSTVERAQIALFSGPLIPNADAVLPQPPSIGVTAQKPDQLIHNTFEVHALGRQNGKSSCEVKTELAAEDRARPRAGAIAPVNAVLKNVVHQIEICLHAALMDFLGGKPNKVGRPQPRASAHTGAARASSSPEHQNQCEHPARGKIPL